jgi:hypothetical protein
MPTKLDQSVHRLGAALSLLAMLLLGGCSSISGAPPRLTSVDVLATEDPDYKQTLDRFYRQKDEAGQVRVRNQFVETRIAIVDHEYLKFRQSLYQGRVSTELATDIGLLTLNAAGATVSSTAAKTTYAALSAALVGSKTSIDKNVYFERTVSALLSQMDTLRNNKKIVLFEGLTQPIAKFPLSHAKAETDEYYLAGTIARAIQGVNAETAATAARSEVNLRNQIKGFLASQGIASTVADPDVIGDRLNECYRTATDADRVTINAELKALGYDKSISEFVFDTETRETKRAVLLTAVQAKGVCKD